MKTTRAFLMLGALCMIVPRLSSAQAPAVAKGFDAYAIVKTRNVFDPDRVPFFAASEAPRPRVVEPPRRYTDSITLTGIMVNGGKAYAFFFGSRSDDDKVLGVNGVIAGARVTKITDSTVELDQNGKKYTLPVGQTASFDSSAPGGSFAPAPAPATAADSAAPPPSDTTAPAPATPLPGNLNEVMRRMMERRQQQLQ